jgi:hypothetical protein
MLEIGKPNSADRIFSGYTPTALRTIFTSAQAAERIQRVEEYQAAHIFYGFTARQLQDLGMFPDPLLRSAPALSNHMQ